MNLRVDRPIMLGRFREGMAIVPFFDASNLFNHAPPSIYYYSGLGNTFGTLDYDYVANNRVSDLDANRGRDADTRKVQFGYRFSF